MKRFAIVVVAVACAFMVFGCSQQKKPAKSGGKADLKVIHFDFDKSNIRSDAEPILKDNAKWLNNNSGTKVTIEGHCDNRGSVEYNIALGDRRANSAKNYMKNLGVAEGRMSTISYGEERPVCKENNEKCWWQNRRDEFVAR